MSPKETLREDIKRTLKNFSGEDFASSGSAAAALLCSSPLWPRYETVFLFLAMKSEIDTQPLLVRALSEGKKVFVPRVEPGGLVFCRILSPEGPWQRGSFGIREPARLPDGQGGKKGEGKQAGVGDFPALVITPGLAFDREGNRLGHGKAYYDRFFAGLDKEGLPYTALGFCMDIQIVEHVPAGDTDRKVNGLLTGTELKLPWDIRQK